MVTDRLTAVPYHNITWRICFDSFFDPLVKIERKKKLHPPPLSKKV